MKTYLNKDGFVMFDHGPLSFDQHCLAYPSETIQRDARIEVRKYYIPYTEETTRIVYFVDAIKGGDHYGQYQSEEKAKDRALFLSNLSDDDLRKEDR